MSHSKLLYSATGLPYIQGEAISKAQIYDIVEKYNNGMSIATIAQETGRYYNTVKKYCERGVQKLKKKTPSISTKQTWENIAIDISIEHLLDLNPSMYIKDIKEQLDKIFGKPIKFMTIWRRVQFLGYRRKRVSATSTKKYLPINLQWKNIVVATMHSVDLKLFYFLDESHFQMKSINRQYAWVKKSVKRDTISTKITRKRYSLLALINSEEGLVQYDLKDNQGEGATNNSDFNEFLAICAPLLREGAIIFLDNASIHLEIEAEIQQILDQRKITLFFNAPYWSSINPIEIYFAIVKQHLKAHYLSSRSFFDCIIAALQSVSKEQIMNTIVHAKNKLWIPSEMSEAIYSVT